MKKKITKLEDRILENNLIFHGIEESEWEEAGETTSKIRKVIVDTLPLARQNDRYDAFRKILIHKVKCI